MDRLEDDLRRVLTDPRRALPPQLVPLEGVHRGAVRRRRVRVAGAAGLTALVLVGGAAIASRPLGSDSHGSLPAGHSPTPTVSAPVSPSPSVSPTPTPSAAASSGRAARPLPAGFEPRSFTAIGTRTYWVLGTASCGTPPCAVTLARTSDGGRTFTTIPAPPAGWTPGGEGSTTDTVSDVRFAGARDGWAFGGGLWSTHDGGQRWHRVPMPGKVLDVEAGAGVAWAIVEKSDGTRALMQSDATIDGWSDLTPTWATPSTLAVDGKRVVVWASATSTRVIAGGKPALLSTTDAGHSWATSPTPSCSPDLGGRVSASGGGVWLACPTGTAAAVYPRPLSDASATLDASALGGGSLPNSVVVAPRDGTTAALGLGADGIAVVTSSGTVLHKAAVGGAPTWIGFTTPEVGYALVSTASSPATRLLRTADGGATWTAVSFG